MTLVTAPIALPTALVSRPTEPSSCVPRSGRLALGHQAERSGELHQPVELRGDDDAQRLELRGDGRPGEPEDPAEEAEAEQDG